MGGVALGLPLTPNNLADAQIRSYAKVSSTNGTLQFGREITLNGLGSSLSALTAPIVGASVLQTWDSTATVTADVAAGQTYRVTFAVNTDGGLPVTLLNGFNFGILGAGIQHSIGGSTTALNLVNMLTAGSGNNATASYDFVSTQTLSEIGFRFLGSALADASALGSTAANQNFVTFSGLNVTNVTAIPETSSATLMILAGFFGITRRRR